jgi:hypothetical protein
MQNGKGSKPRPINDFKKFQNNWDDINWNASNNKNKKKIDKKKNDNILQVDFNTNFKSQV